jgi:hypothetical protein
LLIGSVGVAPANTVGDESVVVANGCVNVGTNSVVVGTGILAAVGDQAVVIGTDTSGAAVPNGSICLGYQVAAPATGSLALKTAQASVDTGGAVLPGGTNTFLHRIYINGVAFDMVLKAV